MDIWMSGPFIRWMRGRLRRLHILENWSDLAGDY